MSTLGLLWNNGSDMFVYYTTLKHCHEAFTKRTVLSVIAGIYYPLGLLGPVVFLSFMQQLWQAKTNWDEVLSDSLLPKWRELYSKLNLVNKINVNRCIKSNPYTRSFQIHGFADASCEGYGCCIYARIVYDNRPVSYTHLDVYKRQGWAIL